MVLRMVFRIAVNSNKTSKDKIMYQIAICENETKILEHLHDLCADILDEINISYKIETFENTDSLTKILYSRPSNFDLLLLDIVMDGISGIEFARQLRSRQNLISIIFITAHEDYLLEGYSVQPLWYLLKPVSREELATAIQTDLQRNYLSKTVVIKSRNRSIALDTENVIFIESMNHTLHIHLTGKTLSIHMTLTNAQNVFPADSFSRCHKSYLVNLHWIADISRTKLKLRNGDILPVGRNYQLQLQSDFVRYLNHL